MHLGHDLLQGGDVAGGVDFREPGFDRIHAAGVDAGFVHAGAVVVADDLFDAALGGVLVGGGGFENVVQAVFCGFAGLPALAPAGHGGRNRIVGAPGAVGEFVEVIAGGGFAIEIGDVDALGLGGLGESEERQKKNWKQQFENAHENAPL